MTDMYDRVRYVRDGIWQSRDSFEPIVCTRPGTWMLLRRDGEMVLGRSLMQIDEVLRDDGH